MLAAKKQYRVSRAASSQKARQATERNYAAPDEYKQPVSVVLF